MLFGQQLSAESTTGVDHRPKCIRLFSVSLLAKKQDSNSRGIHDLVRCMRGGVPEENFKYLYIITVALMMLSQRKISGIQ